MVEEFGEVESALLASCCRKNYSRAFTFDHIKNSCCDCAIQLTSSDTIIFITQSIILFRCRWLVIPFEAEDVVLYNFQFPGVIFVATALSTRLWIQPCNLARVCCAAIVFWRFPSPSKTSPYSYKTHYMRRRWHPSLNYCIISIRRIS